MGKQLLTAVVGSYPQPDWLIDRALLTKMMAPRVRVPESPLPQHVAMSWMQRLKRVFGDRDRALPALRRAARGHREH